MDFERGRHRESYSEVDRTRAEKVALAMLDEGASYPVAVRKILRGEGVFDEGDIERNMKNLSALASETKKGIEKERCIVEEDEREIFDEVSREDTMKEEVRRQRSTNEDVITPDGEDLSDR